MKRQLNRAAALDKRARKREASQKVREEEEVEEDEEEDVVDDAAIADALEAGASSEDDDDDDDADAGDADADAGASATATAVTADPTRKVRGVHSEKDAAIMKARKAAISRVENIVPYRNKQRVLIFCSRGVTSRFRHLMEDMRALLPHHRTEVKHDTKRNLREINELCELKGCNNCLFFEARKSKDLYMWIAKTPNGPSVKFHVLNIHTMEELRLTGNCLKGARPFLCFADGFEADPTLRLIKELFTQVFGTPRGHPKSKPFSDHVMSFSLLDGKIWYRHFQITDSTQDAGEIRQALKSGEETVKLVEIGPRFVLDLIKVFDGSFGGRTLVANPAYVTPNAQRSALKKAQGSAYADRVKAAEERAARTAVNVLPHDPIREVFR